MALLQKFTAQGYFTGGGQTSAPDTSEIENALLSSSFGTFITNTEQIQQKLGHHILQQQQLQQQQAQQYQQHQQEDGSGMSNYASRPEVHRSQLNFSPFSPEPNNMYMSSEPVRRDSYSRLESLPHPSTYGPGFFPMQQGHDLKVNTGVGAPKTAKISPTQTRTSSGNLYGFSDHSDPPTPINRAPGRSEAPISRPSSGQMAAPHSEDIQDLNGTLASLDLDRPWKSPEVTGSRSG